MRRRPTLVAFGAVITVVLASLGAGCSTDQDDPPGIDGPAVVDTSVSSPDTDPAPEASSPAGDEAAPTSQPPTTDGLIGSIDGPVVVGSTP